MSYYPDLDRTTLKNLKVIRQLAKEQPGYFDAPECPYGSEIQALIMAEGVGKGNASDAPNRPPVEPVGELDLLQETKDTLIELKNSKPSSGDPASLMSYYRTKTTLIDKLSVAEARGKNSKDISEFYTTILGIMEEISTPTQVSVIREKLKEFASLKEGV